MNYSNPNLPTGSTAYEAPAALTPTAIELGEVDLTSDMERFAEFIEEHSDDREPSKFFGPISTSELFAQVILNRKADDDQIAAAARLIRARYVAHFRSFVLDRASRAMEA